MMSMKLATAGLVAAAATLLSACEGRSTDTRVPSGSAGPSASSAAAVRSRVDVTSVRVFVKDGRVQAYVQGEIGDGCTSLERVAQSRTGNEIDIEITRVRVGDPCTMILKLLNEWVPLDGAFAPGAYTVRANDVSVEVTLVEADGQLRIEPDPGPLPDQ